MRLSTAQIESIRHAVARFDPAASVHLFGSRTDDRVRGGDIDLLIYSRLIGPAETRLLRLRLADALGEQKIDLVIAAPDSQDPFVRHVAECSVAL